MRVRVRDDVAQSKIVDEPPAVTGRRLAKGY